ncbi:SAC3/GANP family protein [Necator americanus]|uniref:SAC3/GANP family protein n=1 Tax=Necator americanus TaxID=51031 RepID=W2STI3_NECAM|nr:SAC3/GANP family protein [Necator americanus]ETN72161.1 SAC3/GANP family protein [Necator americanus]
MSTKGADSGRNVKGLCKTMCPESEIQFRCSNGMIHILERCRDSEKNRETHKLVKEYARPAAGRNHLHPESLRPPDVLVETVHYLLKLYEQEKEKRFDSVYTFVCDRLRAVRQDMILQNLPAVDTIRILEAMIPFYFESEYLCRTKRYEAYDWKLHSNYLEECLSRWSDAAVHVPKHLISSRIVCAYILHQIPLCSGLNDMFQWKDFLANNLFDILREITIAYRSNNYVRFFRKLFQLPSDCIVVAAVKAVESLRHRAFSTISIAYKSPNSSVPISVLANWLHYNDVCDLIDLLSSCTFSRVESVLISSINMDTLMKEDSAHLLAKF